MTAFSANGNSNSAYDFDLGVPGFRYSDLFDAVKLRELAEKFYDDLAEKDPIIHAALIKYHATRGQGFERRAESKLLTDAAPYLSEFVARMFGVTKDRERMESEILEQNPIWKYKFFVQRRAIKQFSREQLAEMPVFDLGPALTELRYKSFDETIIHDDELAIASITARLLEAEEGRSDDLIHPAILAFASFDRRSDIGSNSRSHSRSNSRSHSR